MSVDHDKNIKLSQLYNTYKDSLIHLAKTIVKNDNDAEDIVQIAMLKTMKILSDIDTVNSPSTRALLKTITKNTAIDCYRKRRRETLLPSDDGVYELAFTTYSPEDAYFSTIYYQNVFRQIQRLPAIYQEILWLRCINGLSTRETAAILGISEPAANTRLSRARKILEKSLCEE